MTEGTEVYLGDGLYASFDGWQIVLRAPRLDGDHEVCLEPLVLVALLEFVVTLDDTPMQQALWEAAQRHTNNREV